MIKLTLGVLLWSFAHFIPAGFTGLRKNLIARLGENGYKGIFALLMALAIYLLVSGWKAALPESLYLPPAWGRHLTALLMLAGFVLFFAPYPANNIRRALRHPQLTGVLCWGVGHLLANGEGRSLVLFGGFAAWALVEIVLLNRRDGAWIQPAPAPRKNDFMLVAGGLAAYVAVAAAHQWLFGFSPFIG
ncbi:MAG TPA: NnrU family protein [Xanthomonadales bacterium]|nr:NnrU family protein [Xanthomonadales bacterium]